MTQEDLVESRMLELEREFRRYLRAAPEVRARLPGAAQLVYLDPDDPGYNAAALARATSVPDSPGAPARRFVVMSDPPALYDDLPPVALAPLDQAEAATTRGAQESLPGASGRDTDWALVAGTLVTGELRTWGALVRPPRRGTGGALAAFESASCAELDLLRAAGVAAPHALVTAARIATALVVARTLARWFAAIRRRRRT